MRHDEGGYATSIRHPAPLETFFDSVEGTRAKTTLQNRVHIFVVSGESNGCGQTVGTGKAEREIADGSVERDDSVPMDGLWSIPNHEEFALRESDVHVKNPVAHQRWVRDDSRNDPALGYVRNDHLVRAFNLVDCNRDQVTRL